MGIYHVVKRGENLFRIGKAYDIPYRDIARLNRIPDPHEILAGQRIFIRGATRQLPVETITPVESALEPAFVQEPRSINLKDGFIWPLKGSVTSKFGPRGETFHDGIDIAAPERTPIKAVKAGEVIYSDRLRGYGNLIIIRHPGGFASVYSHNSRNFAQAGKRVGQGEIIAEVGATGRVSGPHLHFEIRRHNVAQNPLYYLP